MVTTFSMSLYGWSPHRFSMSLYGWSPHRFCASWHGWSPHRFSKSWHGWSPHRFSMSLYGWSPHFLHLHMDDHHIDFVHLCMDDCHLDFLCLGMDDHHIDFLCLGMDLTNVFLWMRFLISTFLFSFIGVGRLEVFPVYFPFVMSWLSVHEHNFVAAGFFLYHRNWNSTNQFDFDFVVDRQQFWNTFI
jgi:hypothetical protein